jgi:rhodanese-related sulfurtransferase
MRELNPEQEIIVICHHGVRSRMVGLYLENHGFSNIINLVGGVEAWAREVDPNMPTY